MKTQQIQLMIVDADEIKRLRANDPKLVGLPVCIDVQAFVDAVWPVPDPDLLYTIILEIGIAPKLN
jgi:hypothetical protein